MRVAVETAQHAPGRKRAVEEVRAKASGLGAVKGRLAGFTEVTGTSGWGEKRGAGCHPRKGCGRTGRRRGRGKEREERDSAGRGDAEKGRGEKRPGVAPIVIKSLGRVVSRAGGTERCRGSAR